MLTYDDIDNRIRSWLWNKNHQRRWEKVSSRRSKFGLKPLKNFCGFHNVAMIGHARQGKGEETPQNLATMTRLVLCPTLIYDGLAKQKGFVVCLCACENRKSLSVMCISCSNHFGSYDILTVMLMRIFEYSYRISIVGLLLNNRYWYILSYNSYAHFLACSRCHLMGQRLLQLLIFFRSFVREKYTRQDIDKFTIRTNIR